MTKIKIAVAGCLGRMGQELSKKIIANNKLEFVGGFEHKKHKNRQTPLIVMFIVFYMFFYLMFYVFVCFF